MPWKECHVEDERLRFVARLLDGEKMARLCAEFGISRKTGYKIYDRYKEVGLQGLTDRSRRPYRHANQLPMAIESIRRGAPRKSGSACVSAAPRCSAPPLARCMPCSTGTAW
jgi:transposase